MSAPLVAINPNEARRRWRGLVTAINSAAFFDVSPARDLAPALKALKGVRFPVEGASARACADAGLLLAQALIDAGTDYRREVVRKALAACGEAIDALLIDEAAGALRARRDLHD